MVTAVDAWERYAEKSAPRRATNAAGSRTWINWTQYPDHGPGESLLGDVAGRNVLELGSGTGANLAHLASLGAGCVGVDLAPSRKAKADRTWADQANMEFCTADAVDYLTGTPAKFDVIYSIFGAVWFTDPEILVPLVLDRLTPGGLFVFSQLPAEQSSPEQSSPGQSSSGRDRVIRKWNHLAGLWAGVLVEFGFGSATAEVVAPPVAGQAGTLVVRAVRT
jgi:SAM-dependent methyltransferase